MPDPKLLALPCTKSQTLFLREDILDMESAAEKFEQEEDIIFDVQQHCRHGDDFVLLSSIFSTVDTKGYVPYSEITFGLNEASPRISNRSKEPADISSSRRMLCTEKGNLISNVSGAPVSHTVPSSTFSSEMEAVESISRFDNVQFLLVFSTILASLLLLC